MSSPRELTQSVYDKFSHAPIKYREELVSYVLVSMVGPDGTLLYENSVRGLLHKIIRCEDVDSLERYLAIDPEAIGSKNNDSPDYYSLFYFAHESGSIGALRFLLLHQETVPECVSYRKETWPLLNEAAHKAHTDFVRFLLDNQPAFCNIHGRDTFGCTPILQAARIWPFGEGEVDSREPSVEKCDAVINLLLDRGASASDVMQSENTTHTVLTFCVRWEGPELVKKLINGGADVHAKVTARHLGLDLKPISDMTAVSFAAFHANFDAMRTLFDSQDTGIKIRDMASFRDSSESEKTQMIQDIIKVNDLLLNIDPSAINVQDNFGNTPLHYATDVSAQIYKQWNLVLQFLCSKGADASIRNSKKETPLHAMFGGPLTTNHADNADTEPLRVLCGRGASVNDTTEEGVSPLHLALTGMRSVDAVSFLLEQGADPNLMEMFHDTPLHVAASNRFWGEEDRKHQDRIVELVSKVAGDAGMNIPNGDGKTVPQLIQEEKKLREKDDLYWLDARKPHAQ